MTLNITQHEHSVGIQNHKIIAWRILYLVLLTKIPIFKRSENDMLASICFNHEHITHCSALWGTRRKKKAYFINPTRGNSIFSLCCYYTHGSEIHTCNVWRDVRARGLPLRMASRAVRGLVPCTEVVAQEVNWHLSSYQSTLGPSWTSTSDTLVPQATSPWTELLLPQAMHNNGAIF